MLKKLNMKSMKLPALSDLAAFGDNYSPAKLFDKISSTAKKAGVKTVYSALLLYYALLDGNVSLLDKAMVVGALGYFILPVDVLPDILPGGFIDDLGLLVKTLKSIWKSITAETRKKALERLKTWFPSVNESDLDLFSDDN